MTMLRLEVSYVDDPGRGGKLINKQRTEMTQAVVGNNLENSVRRRLRLGFGGK